MKFFLIVMRTIAVAFITVRQVTGLRDISRSRGIREPFGVVLRLIAFRWPFQERDKPTFSSFRTIKFVQFDQFGMTTTHNNVKNVERYADQQQQ
jgi:hypothetical protein